VKKKLFFVIIICTAFLTGAKLKFKEDFFRLHYMPLKPDNPDYQRNLFWLQYAVSAPYAPPIQALVISKTPEMYEKYKILLQMTLFYHMAMNEIAVAARFDKHEPVFFNKEYAADIIQSLSYARVHYNNALSYWNEMVKYKTAAEKYKKIEIDMSFQQDILTRVDDGTLNLERVVTRKLENLDTKAEFFRNP